VIITDDQVGVHIITTMPTTTTTTEDNSNNCGAYMEAINKPPPLAQISWGSFFYDRRKISVARCGPLRSLRGFSATSRWLKFHGGEFYMAEETSVTP